VESASLFTFKHSDNINTQAFLQVTETEKSAKDITDAQDIMQSDDRPLSV